MNWLNNFDAKDKKECPYNVKCYRKNPIHFNEMSHPHLEKLLGDHLEGKIEIPEDLDFECTDRSQLLDQLKILQLVLRNERNKTKGVNSEKAKKPISETKNPVSAAKNLKQETEDWKSKIEKHKSETSTRRLKKLLDMDKNQALVDKSNKTDQQDDQKTFQFQLDDDEEQKDSTEETDVIILKDREAGDKSNVPIEEVAKNKQNLKRQPDTLNNQWFSVKKLKMGDKNLNIEKSQDTINNSIGTSKIGKDNAQSSKKSQETMSSGSQDSEKSSSSGTSIIDAYDNCSTSKSREEMRKTAIKMMRRQGYDVSIVEPGGFSLKYALSAPYHLFYTRVHKSKETYNQQNSITFPEILDTSLGEIDSCLQINFMVDVGWLCLQYLLAGQRTNMLILYGDRVDEEKVGPHIQLKQVVLPMKFGCHHSKVMILRYKDRGIRVVVSTANLYSDDWENRTQGVWISPHLPELSDCKNPNDGESPTMFKKDFLAYLNKYKEPALSKWLDVVRGADFSSVNVFFVGSVPGSHKDRDIDSWGHRKVGHVLSNHVTLPSNAKEWPVVAQCSSIGSLGPTYETWVLKEIVSSMSRTTDKGLRSHPNFQFIYPSLNNYKQSYDARVGSSCLPYSGATHNKQKWVESYMYQWKASKTGRSQAIPHIKTYTRISPDLSEIPWFVLTSANLSKAAWGTCKNTHYIMSYEAGVIFIPKFILNKKTFPIKDEISGVPIFPMPYDLPLTRYESGDKPFVMEVLQGFDL